ncbi:amidase family protein [Haloactinospora alba]|uniref:amidase family protein n=1 Tax=Haloactinospora alba TaxID=405555 RepID=UPI001FEB1812|nr:amidase family protein [Haloactinospora alba]
MAWSATLGFAASERSITATARSALQRLADRGLLRLVERPVELADPGTAWAALRTGGSTAERQAARQLRADNDRRLAAAFAELDLIATPTTPNPPHGHHGPGARMSVALTWAFNLSGHPAVSLPAGLTPDGEPVGLQLVGRHGGEGLLLAVAAQHEAA